MNAKKPRRPCAAGCGRRANTAVARYCSLRCQFDEEYRRRVELLERGDYPPSECSSGFLRRYLVAKYAERCSLCNWEGRNPVTGRVTIEVEHIDGDWRNNRPENLTLLCPNCHSLTPAYRALNRGRGRSFRKKGERGIESSFQGYERQRRALPRKQSDVALEPQLPLNSVPT